MEKSKDILSNGIEDACSDVFSGRGGGAWSHGMNFKDYKSDGEWVEVSPGRKRLVKRTSPR